MTVFVGRSLRAFLLEPAWMFLVASQGDVGRQLFSDVGQLLGVQGTADHPILTSASSSLDFWVKSFQFHAGIFDAELPVDPALFGIRLVRPRCDFSLQFS